MSVPALISNAAKRQICTFQQTIVLFITAFPQLWSESLTIFARESDEVASILELKRKDDATWT